MSRTTRRLWMALFILLPLAYNPCSYRHYEPDKTALLMALTGLLLGSAIWHGELPPAHHDHVERWIAVYLAIRWLSLAGSIAPDWSLWGDPVWRNGLWTMLAGSILFILARRQFATSQQREWAINAILIGSAPVAAYGVLEYLNPFDSQDVVRAGSTQGYAVLLAAYFAMVLPLTVMRLLDSPRRRWIGALLALQSVCLVFTYARAGWLAAIGGLGTGGIAWLWLNRRRRLAFTSLTLLIAGLMILFTLSLLPSLSGSAPHSLQTVTSMFRWKGPTARIRLLTWEASLDAIRARPWLGYGPATFRTVFEWYMPPKLAPFGGSPILGGRMHNVYLETALESGLIGLAAYAAVLVAVLGPLVQTLFRSGGTHRSHHPTQIAATTLFCAAVLAALVANLVNNVFLFDSATTTLLFWSLAGMAHAKPASASALEPPVSRHRVRGGIVAAMGIVLASWIAIPDMMVYRGERLVQEKRWPDATKWIESAIDRAPTPDLFYAMLGDVYADWATETRDPAVWQHGTAVYARLIANRNQVAGYHARHGLYLRRWATLHSEPTVATQAAAAYTTAIHLSPRDPNLWLDRGLVRLNAGDLTGALGDFEEANRLLGDYARYYGAMSIYALMAGDHEAAAVWNARAIQAQREWDNWVWRR